MAFRKEDYPPNWTEIREAVRQRAGDRCEGSPNYPDCRAINGWPHPVTGTKVVCTTASATEPVIYRIEEWKWIKDQVIPRGAEKLHSPDYNLHHVKVAAAAPIDRALKLQWHNLADEARPQLLLTKAEQRLAAELMEKKNAER
jgi:hypothetical protein